MGDCHNDAADRTILQQQTQQGCVGLLQCKGSVSLFQFFPRKHKGSVFFLSSFMDCSYSTLLQTFIFCRSLVNISVHNMSTLRKIISVCTSKINLLGAAEDADQQPWNTLPAVKKNLMNKTCLAMDVQYFRFIEQIPCNCPEYNTCNTSKSMAWGGRSLRWI